MVGQLAERHADFRQRVRLGLNDVLFLVAAALVNFRDARHGAKQRLDGVFLDFAKFDELLQLGRGLVRSVGAILDVVVKNLAEARADGSEFRQRASRELFEHSLQTLGNQLTGAVNVCAVLELKSHLRETEFRNGTHFLDARQTGEFTFEWLRDELFRFFGGERGDFGIYLDLNAGDVWHGVNRQMQRRPEARSEQRGSAEQNYGALTEREFEDAVNHGVKDSEICPASPFGPR